MKKKYIFLLSIAVLLLFFVPLVAVAGKTDLEPPFRVVLLGGQKGQVRPCG